MRAVVQGIDAQDSWDRYLRAEGEHRDGRTVRRTIDWVRDAFAAAARQAKRPGLARLILLEPARFSDAAVPPSLEDFATQHGLEDFSAAEQIEAYNAAFASDSVPGGQRRKSGRRARVIAKQLEALRWLEQRVAQAPSAADPLSAWLDEPITRRLARAGLVEVAQLVQHIKGVGERWWLHIPGIGRHKGARIVEWLTLHADDIQMNVGAHVLLPRRRVPTALFQTVVKSGTALCPYEKFQAPPGLEGAPGTWREGEGIKRLSARNDREALDAWLDAPSDTSAGARTAATRRSYRKEAERLLLWALLVHRKALSALVEEDVQAYCDFLRSPPADWCGPRHVQRWSPHWRPLEGALAPAAIGQAVTVLHGLFAFWRRHHYVRSNPFAAALGLWRPPPAGARSSPIAPSDWAALEFLLAQDMQAERGRRVARAMRWLRFSHLGLAELTTVRCKHLQRVQYAPKGAEWLVMQDAGSRRRHETSIPVALIEEFEEELRRHGRPARVTDPENQDVHILARFGAQADRLPPWSTSGLAKAIRAAFDRAAAQADHAGAQRWAQASALSLRAERVRQPAARRKGRVHSNTDGVPTGSLPDDQAQMQLARPSENTAPARGLQEGAVA